MNLKERKPGDPITDEEIELLEWHIPSSGKDGLGVAVVYDLEKGELVPNPNFRDRVIKWRESGNPDSYYITNIPTYDLVIDYLEYRAGFNINKHCLELNPSI